MRDSYAIVRDLSVIFAQFISDFSLRKSVKMVNFLDGQARKTKLYKHDLCVYVLVGQCDWALTNRISS
jgi:hypothetical protein